jgi:hypothetical protein
MLVFLAEHGISPVRYAAFSRVRKHRLVEVRQKTDAHAVPRQAKASEQQQVSGNAHASRRIKLERFARSEVIGVVVVVLVLSLFEKNAGKNKYLFDPMSSGAIKATSCQDSFISMSACICGVSTRSLERLCRYAPHIQSWHHQYRTARTAALAKLQPDLISAVTADIAIRVSNVPLTVQFQQGFANLAIGKQSRFKP